MKKVLLLLVAIGLVVAQTRADDMDQYLPATWGGWKNLTNGIHDNSLFGDQMPTEVAISGNTIHMAWIEKKAMSVDVAGDGKYGFPVFYRRSTDLGKTWEAVRAVGVMNDLGNQNYLGTNGGSNSHWMAVSGEDVYFAIPENHGDDLDSDQSHSTEMMTCLLCVTSHDNGATFVTDTIYKRCNSSWTNRKLYSPQIVADGQTVVVAANMDYSDAGKYKVAIWESHVGGFSGPPSKYPQYEIDYGPKDKAHYTHLADLRVSGNKFAVMSYQNSTDSYDVYRLISVNVFDGDGSTDNDMAVNVGSGFLYKYSSTVEYLHSPQWTYHPQMVLQGDIIDVMYKGSLAEGDGYNHTIHQRSTDGGKTWSEAQYLPESTGGDGSTGTIAAKGDNIYIYTTWQGMFRIYHSHDGGKTWDIQHRAAWNGWRGTPNGYNLRYGYHLSILPDDPTGQHAILTGVRGYYAETHDGFRTISRNFVKGYESWDDSRATNNDLQVLLDDQGRQHWFMHYSPAHESFNENFYSICYRRVEDMPATGSTDMALNLYDNKDEYGNDRPSKQVVIPITESLMETKDAMTVEFWLRLDSIETFQIASLSHVEGKTTGSEYNGGWFINVNSSSDWWSVRAGFTTEQSVDGIGSNVQDDWRNRRYQIKQKGQWHHVALTYDSKVKADNVRLYIDGLLLAKATEQGPIMMGNNPIVIGKGQSSERGKALVDNFSIWSKALSEDQLREHIYTPPTGKEDDCRLLLTFDGSLKDQSQYHNDPVPLNDYVLTEHDGIRPVQADFMASKDMMGMTVNLTDMTQGGEACWWILPYPGYPDSHKTSEKRFESVRFDNNPGTYNITMVAAPTGEYNAYGSMTQMLTIGGLKKVEPAEAGQDVAVRLNIQGGYDLSYYNQPKVFLHKDGTVIEGKWLVEYGYDSKKVESPNDLAPAIFDLSTAALGKYDVVVGEDTLYQAFTVESSEFPSVWMRVNGRGESLWNKYQRYTIDYGSYSNVAAYNTPIFLVIPDRFGTVDVEFDFDFDLCNVALDDYGQEIAKRLGDHLMAYDEKTGDSIRIYSFMIPYVAPNSTNQVSFRIKMNKDSKVSSDEITMYYWAEQPWGPFDPDAANPDGGKARTRAPYSLEQGECFATAMGKAGLETVIGFIPGVNCIYSAGKTVLQVADSEQRSWSSFLCNSISTVFSCVSGPASILGHVAFNLASGVWNSVSTGIGASECLNGKPDSFKNKGVGSYDPNEMIGPSGYDDNAHYIQPIHNMAYTITYENKSTATAPAHEVFINDKLDLSKYDAETFSFTSFGWADTTIVVGGSLTKEFTRDIKYKVKGEDIIVRVSGTFDEETGVVDWSMISLDKNGNEIEDPSLGYLLPNNDDHVGEGFVSFSINHKPNPANGSTISNKATIIFDANEPIETNTFVNTFDTDYPTSKISKVEQSGSHLVLTIEGSDATSGIASYDVYVFKNGGEAETLVYGLPEGSPCILPYEAGTKYAFCVIANDHVGWKEAKDIKPEFEYVGETITINISSAHQVPYYSAYNLDFTDKPELKAYVATGYDKTTGTIWLTRVKQVPALTGFLLMGDEGSYDVYIVESASNAYYKNMFKGTLEGTTLYTTDGDYTNYYLSKGDAGVGFYKVTKEEGVKVGANRCYLPILTEIPAEGSEGDTELIKVSAAKQVPYFTSKNLDFTMMEAQGVKAYTATGYNYGTGVIWLTRVKKVPAKTGILVMTDKEGEYNVPTASVQSVYENMFVGSETAQTIYTNEEIDGVDYVNYYLSSGTAGVGFYKVTNEDGVKMGANRCYLPIPKRDAASSARGKNGESSFCQMILSDESNDDVIAIPLFADDATGINVQSSIFNLQLNEVYYNLQGQRVDNPGKGLYIKNGRRVVIK